MATVTIRIKKPPPTPVLREWFKRALNAAAVKAVSIIRLRTARGVDADGRPFKPYTPAYAVLKGSTGRSVSPVDLTLTGQMLNNLKVKAVTHSRSTIGFSGVHRATRFGRRVQRRSAAKAPRTLKRTRSNGQARTVPMAAVVIGTDRIRPWFHLRSKDDLQALTRAGQASIDADVRAFNAKKA